MKILSNRTKTELGVDLTVPNSPMTLVYVQCSQCSEQFVRHLGQVDLPHQCIYKEYTHPMPVRAEFKRLHPDALVPSRKRSTDAGYDVNSIQHAVINPQQITQISTGLVLTLPEGWYYTVEGRSGLTRRGIVPFSGTIDSTYTGELIIALMNISNEAYTITKGDRIAQIIIKPIHSLDITVVDEISPSYSGRGTLGFGSSGK